MIDIALRRYNLALGAGHSQLAGKVLRIGHPGDLNELMTVRRPLGSRDGDERCGPGVRPGAGVGAGRSFWRGSVARLVQRLAVAR